MGPRRRRWHFGPRAMALWASPALLVPGPGKPRGREVELEVSAMIIMVSITL